MRMSAWRLLALTMASALLLSIPSSEAHNWVPVYNGAKWAQACSAPGGARRVAPPVCCQQSGSFCRIACGLVDIDDAWKNACRANCQTATTTCLQNVQLLPPATGIVPGAHPPATTN